MPPWVSEIQPTQITFGQAYIAIGILVFIITTGYCMWRMEKKYGKIDIEEAMVSAYSGLVVGVLWVLTVPLIVLSLLVWATVNKLSKRALYR